MASKVAADLPFRVPNHIKRSPTALLKALSSTVGTDVTAPHYAFIDDPLTIPTTNMSKRNYFLAKVYERIRADNLDLSKECLQELFQMSAYYNGCDPPPSEVTEWPGVRNYFEDTDSVWTKNGSVDLLFKSVEPTAENYSILIAAKAKYGDQQVRNEALDLLKEMTTKLGLIPSEDVFVNLLRTEQGVKNGRSLLKRMAELNIRPTIRTVNAYLTCLNKMEVFDQKWTEVKKWLAESARLGLRPNLTTYNLVLSMLRTQRDRNSQQDLVLAVSTLDEILSELEARPSIECSEFTDQDFFVTAMSVATNANNSDIVDRIEQMYQSAKNSVKMTAFTVEAIYYSRYLNYKIFVQLTNINEIGKLYTELVPRVVGTSRQITINMLNRMPNESVPWSLLKRVIEDGIAARHLVDSFISRLFLSNLLKVDVGALNLTEADQFRSLVMRMNDIWLELANFTDERVKNRQQKLRPSLVVPLAQLLLRAGERQKAFALLDVLVEGNRNLIVTEDQPQLAHVWNLFDQVVETAELAQSANVLELVARYHPDQSLDKLADKVSVRFGLNGSQQRVLTNFVRLRT